MTKTLFNPIKNTVLNDQHDQNFAEKPVVVDIRAIKNTRRWDCCIRPKQSHFYSQISRKLKLSRFLKEICVYVGDV